MEIHIQGDELGPRAIVFVREPAVDLHGCVVVDNVALGPSIGGIRMAPDVTVDEVRRLARAMTLKNAAAGLPHGGGKAVIAADPDAPPDEKEARIRAFARRIRGLEDYIPGPDMGTDEAAMAWIQDEIGRVVGLPRVVGGIPLDEIGATGFGLAVAAEEAAPRADLDLVGARVAVQGFGAVGIHAARFLSERGTTLVAASDSRGGILDPDGLDVDALAEHKRSGAPVSTFPGGGEPTDDTTLVGVACDVWIPAARPDVLTAENVGDLRARLVLQGANIPATDEAEARMHENGVVCVPDFIANAGGVICAAVEYRGGTESDALAVIEEKLRSNTAQVLERAGAEGTRPREAAEVLALERVREGMGYRRP